MLCHLGPQIFKTRKTGVVIWSIHLKLGLIKPDTDMVCHLRVIWVVPELGMSYHLGLHNCDGTSQVIRPTYSCPCLTDIRHPVDVSKSLDKFGIFPYLTRNVSPVLQTLQNIGDKEMRKLSHNLHLFRR
jgi:hypothetical protein